MEGSIRRYIRSVVLLGFALLLHFSTFAQPPAPRLIDSLQQALANCSTDSQRVRLLTALSGNYFGTKPDSGLLLGRQAIQLARRAGLVKEEANARIAVAACLWGLGKHLQAIDEYRLALPVAEQSGDRRLQAQIQHGIAINYGAIDKKDKAINYLKRSLALQLQDGNDSGAMGCYHNLAQYSNQTANKEAALHYYEQALIYARRAKHDRGIAYTYMRLGSQEAALGNETKGINFLKEAQDRFKNMRDTSGMAECWAEQAEVNRRQKRYAQAIYCYQQAIRLQRLVPGQYFRRVLSGYLMELASVYQEASPSPESFQKSRAAWAESFQIAEATQDWQAGARSAQALSQLYRKKGQSGLALTYYEEYIRHRDSFLNIEKEKQKTLHELQTQYNDSIGMMRKLQDKQLTIVRQESDLRAAGILQTRLYALVGVALLALLLSFLLYRNRIQKIRFQNELQQTAVEQDRKTSALQRQIREATLSALQAQMNPHFIFNSLNVIQSFVYAGDKEQASYLIGKFSDLLRQMLQFSRSSLITLEEELSFIRIYTELEQNRMTPDLAIQYAIAPAVDLNRIHLPPLLIQPFVENALRHGLYHKEGARCLHISISGTTDAVEVEIDDNGVGRAAAKTYAEQGDHLGFASGANAQRMMLLNQLDDLQIDLRILDKIAPNGDPEGTTVLISIAQKKT